MKRIGTALLFCSTAVCKAISKNRKEKKLAKQRKVRLLKARAWPVFARACVFACCVCVCVCACVYVCVCENPVPLMTRTGVKY